MTDGPLSPFGVWLMTEKDQRGYSYRQMADALNQPLTSLVQYTRPITSPRFRRPTFSKAREIAEALGADVAHVLALAGYVPEPVEQMEQYEAEALAIIKALPSDVLVSAAIPMLRGLLREANRRAM